MNQVPEHIKRLNGMTGREWKSLKRKQARAALNALKELRMGCAYFPDGGYHVTAAIHDVESVIEEISLKNWGR